MPAPDGPQFQMPSGGITPGAEGLPLYRYIKLKHNDPDFGNAVDDALVAGKGRSIAGKVADLSTQRRLGSHWTHDYEQAKEWADYHGNTDNTLSVIMEAEHPGTHHTMDWNNPKDVGTLENIVVSKEFNDMALPEVSIRPGAPMTVKALHLSGPDPKDKFAQNILHRVPVNKKHEA